MVMAIGVFDTGRSRQVKNTGTLSSTVFTGVFRFLASLVRRMVFAVGVFTATGRC